MEFVVNDPNAVLMKLIPSVQHLNLRDPGHKDYYESLAKNNMPLLCHVGPEYSFPEGIRERERDNFRFLDKPLEYGVTVIAAHCATPVFPIDKNETKEFDGFMKNANSGGKIQLWGDTSAFSLLTRIPILEEILETFPPEWLVHGSDFPIPIEGWVHLPGFTHDMTWEEYEQIKKTENLLDRDVVHQKRPMGFRIPFLRMLRKCFVCPRGKQDEKEDVPCLMTMYLSSAITHLLDRNLGKSSPGLPYTLFIDPERRFDSSIQKVLSISLIAKYLYSSIPRPMT